MVEPFPLEHRRSACIAQKSDMPIKLVNVYAKMNSLLFSDDLTYNKTSDLIA